MVTVNDSRWPEGFNVKLSSTSNEMWLAWIEPDLKKEVQEARRSGKTYPPQIGIYDQFV